MGRRGFISELLDTLEYFFVFFLLIIILPTLLQFFGGISSINFAGYSNTIVQKYETQIVEENVQQGQTYYIVMEVKFRPKYWEGGFAERKIYYTDTEETIRVSIGTSLTQVDEYLKDEGVPQGVDSFYCSPIHIKFYVNNIAIHDVKVEGYKDEWRTIRAVYKWTPNTGDTLTVTIKIEGLWKYVIAATFGYKEGWDPDLVNGEVVVDSDYDDPPGDAYWTYQKVFTAG